MLSYRVVLAGAIAFAIQAQTCHGGTFADSVWSGKDYQRAAACWALIVTVPSIEANGEAEELESIIGTDQKFVDDAASDRSGFVYPNERSSMVDILLRNVYFDLKEIKERKFDLARARAGCDALEAIYRARLTPLAR